MITGWHQIEGVPFLVYAPAGDVRPDHEHQAMCVAAADPGRRPVQAHGPAGRLVTGIPVSRAEWMRFVERVKAGDYDVEVPS